MGQVNIKKSGHVAPPTGALGIGYDSLNNLVRINADGSVTIIFSGTQEETYVENVLANLGVGLLTNLPAISDVGDTYVTTDTFEIYVVKDAVSWDITELVSKQFVTDTSQSAWVLYQYDGTILKQVGDVIAAQPWIDLIPQSSEPSHTEGRLFYDNILKSFVLMNDQADVRLNIGTELWARLQNDNGSTLLNGKAGYVKGASLPVLLMGLAQANDLDISVRTLGLFTQDIADGSQGYLTRYGLVRDVDTSAWAANTILWLSPDTPGGLTDVRPKAPNYPVRIGIVVYSHATVGVIGVDTLSFNGTDTTVNIEGSLNGVVVEKPSIAVLVDTGVIYFETDNENIPTENLAFVVDGTRYLLDTLTGSGTGGKARVALTAGTDTAPQINYIYVVESGGVGILMANTTGFPIGSCPIAICHLKSVTDTDTYGATEFRRWNNSPDNGTGDGILQYITKRLRIEGSKWRSGVVPTVAITTNPSAIDGLKVSVNTGIVFQLHEQSFTSQDGTEYIVVNHPTTPYLRISDLSEIDVDAQGNSLRSNNTRYGLNIIGCQNSADVPDLLLVLLPNGSYSSDENAINDVDNLAVTTVPSTYRDTAFRICRIVVNYSTSASGTFTNLLGAGVYQDERGFPLGVGGGGSGSGASQTEFTDTEFSIYNATDATKILKFLLSGITTGNSRTMTVPDKDITVAGLDDLAFYSKLGVSLGSISFSSITVDESGYYSDENISSNTDIIFASSGHSESIWQKIKLTITTSVLTFYGDINFDSNFAFVNGSTSLNGTYFLWLFYSGSQLHVTLQKTTAILATSTAIELDSTVPQYAYKSAASNVTFGNAVTDSPFSVSCTLQLNDISANQRIVQVANVSSSTYWWIAQMKSDGTFSIALHDETSGNAIYILTNSSFSFGTKHKVVFTYDGSQSENGIECYVNSVLQTVSRVEVGTYTAMHGDNGNQTLTIGGYGDTGVEFPADGLIDDVAIWSVEFDQDDVDELYNSGDYFDITTHSQYANCDSLFKFENDLTDTKGNNDLTGVGSPTYNQL